MLEKPLVYLSNSIEKLVELLRDQLFSDRENPFGKKFVFLPSANLKNPLMTQFVSDGKLDVAMGVDFLELGSGIQTLYKWASGKTLLFPPLDLLALQLEALDLPSGRALHLAKEFLRYGKFGGSFLKKWPDTWQKKYWDAVFSKWNYPYELLEAPLSKPKEQAEIHLFNFPFLPKLYHLFFAKLAAYFPVRYYQFSPCREFWSDTVTDFEKVHLIEKDPQLSLYFEEGNPLLNNLGKVGRQTFRLFEEEDFVSEEHYVEKNSKTYLSKLQSDILNFKKTGKEKDDSVLLLPAASKQREVEILYTKLLEMKVLPSSIQIFAPDISAYAPFIELVFGGEESPFDFTIRDLPSHPLLQTFFDLLSLNDHRFEASTLFKLFSNPYFTPLSEKEIKEVRRWIERSGVKWGVDKQHRKLLLPEILDETESGTWEEAFGELLNNLVFIPEKGTDWDLPYIDFSDAELLGKFITCTRSLRADLGTLYGASMTGADWASCLMTLFNRYLVAEENAFAPFEEKLLLLKELEGTFPFASIKCYLANSLKEKKGVRLSKQLEAITFRSLKPGMFFSSKVIALLGMEEGAFPRPYIRSSLNLLGSQGDYSPTPPDEDRYLFLQLLCAAEETLLITYQNVSEEDGKEQPPSILVQELDPKVEVHPPFPFHQSYFSKPGKVYSKKHYETARTFYGPKKENPFIAEFLHPTPLPEVEVVAPPPFEDLSRFAKNPLRFYCNQVLNLYLHYDDTTDEEFFLSPLQRHKLLNKELALQEAEEKGHLPLGRFKEVARKKIEAEWETLSEERGPGFIYKGKLGDLVKIYPEYLLGLINGEPKPLIHLKTGEILEFRRDPHESFERYLYYYTVALQTPSPLHPHLAPFLLKNDLETFSKKIKTIGSDPYANKLFSDPKQYNPEVIIERWFPLLQKTFEPLLEVIGETV
ncbi:exodeoxyribonuclease V subunit gamma [Candidatus Neptunochlamydia vexilliferae]|uniref:exodeoxyribonuclease V subunit gamma n=1 Tax=Candidatus Neptunichlamydia vexilliferae TaxID=1651774 RepID=UPI0018916E1A|nr:exodeoxyribonuclease V subunit gamma [Candidatus Neptunochlamydia vexilliferae]